MRITFTLMENPKTNMPENLVPVLTKIAKSKNVLQVFGNQYPTKDGTAIRDYIHIQDLANAHYETFSKMINWNNPTILNIGTNHGYSVLEIVKHFEKANNCKIPYEIAPPRNGDVAICIANSAKAQKFLDWKCEQNLAEMLRFTEKSTILPKKSFQ